MPRGGARPGAGPKPSRHKYATAINKAEKRIADRLPELVDLLFKLSKGVSVFDSKALKALFEAIQQYEPERVERIIENLKETYTTVPDRAAIEYLANRIMGKPTEKIEAEYSGDVAVTMVEVIMPEALSPARRALTSGEEEGEQG